MTTSNIASAINAAHVRVESAKREGTKYAIEAGRLLIEAKATVPHGGWDEWLKANVAFSARTAQLYMRLSRTTADDPVKAQRVADLPLRRAARNAAVAATPAVEALDDDVPSPALRIVYIMAKLGGRPALASLLRALDAGSTSKHIGKALRTILSERPDKDCPAMRDIVTWFDEAKAPELRRWVYHAFGLEAAA